MSPVVAQNPLALLEEKNNLLDCFLTLTSEELIKVKAKNFDSLGAFYMQRGKILDLIKTISDHIDRSLADHCLLQDEKSWADQLAAEGHRLTQEILTLDLELISYLDQEKSSVIRELQSVTSGRRVLKAYKSGL